MRKMILLFLLICTPAFADRYVAEKEDGSLIVINYNPSSYDSLEDVFKAHGVYDRPAVRVETSDLPSEPIEYWKLNHTPGKKIKVDLAKKKIDDDAKAAKQAEKEAVLTKLKISEEERLLLIKK